MTAVVSIAAALQAGSQEFETCPDVRHVEPFGECEEDHPLKWLQPTPEISVPVALYLPPMCRLSSIDTEARSSLSHGSTRFPSEEWSDFSNSVYEHAQAEQGFDTFSATVGSGSSLEPPSVVPLPPPSPPRLAVAPLDEDERRASSPPSHSALEEQPFSGMAWQTPSPTCAFASTFPFEPFAICPLQQGVHPRVLVPTTLEEAAGSFADVLGDWSSTAATTDRTGLRGEVAGLEGPVVAKRPAVAELPSSLPPSLGSAEHALGKCKPCAFVHRPVGCADGQACSFCHLCEPGERKRRQKEKFQKVQQRRLRRAQVTSTSVTPAEAPRASFPQPAQQQQACTLSSLPFRAPPLAAERPVGAVMPR